ncbi:hypothetical protein, partial [Brucella neotomae]|uniref:hypothetical protein n=1 Tax=Brucella neotomae TaxID=29460 RepID=UPI001AEC708A
SALASSARHPVPPPSTAIRYGMGALSYVRRNLVESRRLMVEIGLKWTIWSVERKFFFFRETR